MGERARALRPKAEDWMNLRPTVQDAAFGWDMETEFLWTGILWDHVEHFLLCSAMSTIPTAAACQQQMCLVGLRLVANKHSNIDFPCLTATNDVLGRHRVFCVFMWETHRAVDYSGQQVLVTTCMLAMQLAALSGRADTGSVAGGACRGQAGQRRLRAH